MTKTNAMRLCDQRKFSYVVHDYSSSEAVSAEEVAAFLKEDPRRVFNTLVTVGKSLEHYVFVVPATAELSLKKAAQAANEKNIELILQKDLLPLTGYIHGGCSPIGMKKAFPVFVDHSALSFGTILVSAGKVGYQLELSPADLATMTGCAFVDLVDA